MKRIVSATLLLVMIINLTSCSKTSVETTESERVINSNAIVSIETKSEDEAEVEPPFIVKTSDYNVQECDFVIDLEQHTITGIYDDTAVNPNGCVITFNLKYFDYGVDEVSIYQALPSNKLGQSPIDIIDTGWVEGTDSMSPLNVSNESVYRQDLSFNSSLSFNVCSTDTDDELLDLIDLINEYRSDGYNISSYYCEYMYPIADMNDNVSNEYNLYPISNEYETLKKVTLRTNINGIPVGVPSDNFVDQMLVRYGDYYGSISGVTDAYQRSLFNSNIATLVDFIYYNYALEQIESSKSSICPLDECIKNALPALIYESIVSGTNKCEVYAAELVYIPFSDGYVGSEDNTYDVYMVPVWALYTVVNGFNTRVNAIFINAMTGEVISNVADPFE